MDRFDLNGHKLSMKAIVTTGGGGYEKLKYCDIPIPTLGQNEVLLNVLAAGLNNTDINTRLGWYASTVTPFPFVQGTDCCGRVVAVASGLDKNLIGLRVLVRPCMRTAGWGSLDSVWMGYRFDGAFAQFAKAPAAEVFPVNCDWSDAELGTIPCAYGTAENMLHRAKVVGGEQVLIVGASGGVGSAAVQLAKRRGAFVSAITEEAKFEKVLAIGADRVIARNENILTGLGEKSIDVVIDNVAGSGFDAMLKVLKRGGRLASSGAIAGPLVKFDMRDFYLKDLTMIGCTAWEAPVFPNLISYIEKGEIRPLLAKTFPLEQIVRAQCEFTEKRFVGKFVLIPPPLK